MEGPSLYLAAEQLQPFARRRVQSVAGNSTIGIDRLQGKRVKAIFSWGKHLVFQFDRFALRVHFLLWGTFAATVKGTSVTGDYRRIGPPRLVLTFASGEITIWSASLKFIESADALSLYDFTIDILSDEWNPDAALVRMRAKPDAFIADVLLDQAIFAGVGNIIKNEVLFRTRTNALATVAQVSPQAQRAIVADARTFSFRFLELRRQFALRAHLEIHGKSRCRVCGGKISRRIHGARQRRLFFCALCQHVPDQPAASRDVPARPRRKSTPRTRRTE